jgi:hypothetical protein
MYYILHSSSDEKKAIAPLRFFVAFLPGRLAEIIGDQYLVESKSLE